SPSGRSAERAGSGCCSRWSSPRPRVAGCRRPSRVCWTTFSTTRKRCCWSASTASPSRASRSRSAEPPLTRAPGRNMSTDTYHVVVIGGSFAGLAAAIQLGRARRRVLVVDGGKPRNRFSRSSHGFLGQDGRPPAEILATFREQVLAYPTVRFQAAEVDDARESGEGDFAVALSTG